MRRAFALAGLVCAAGTLMALQPPPPAPPAPQPAPARVAPPLPALPPGASTPGTPAPPTPAEEPAAPQREKPDGPPEFETRFADDSLLKVTILDPSLTIVTRYGKLTVPVAEIQRVEIGFRYPDGVETKVDEAATNLGSPSFRDREEAEKALLKYAEYAIPAVRRATRSTDPEVSRRAEGLLKKLLERVPAEKLSLKDHDLIETPELTIRGRVEPATVKVRTRLFGETTLRLAEVRTMRSLLASTAELTLDAARYGRSGDNTWLDTGVDVATDLPLEISVTGTVNLAPGQPGQMSTGPAGTTNQGFGPPMMGMNGQMFQFNPGAVIGRVGPNGRPFTVGAAYKQPRGPASGRLYLRVSPSPFGVEPSGSYKVRVRVGG